jgi:hypothetical protein
MDAYEEAIETPFLLRAGIDISWIGIMQTIDFLPVRALVLSLPPSLSCLLSPPLPPRPLASSTPPTPPSSPLPLPPSARSGA